MIIINNLEGAQNHTGFDQDALIYKALGDKKRLEVIHLLLHKKEICVAELAPLMNMAQSKLSYHLKVLLEANLVKWETRGTFNFYAVNRPELDKYVSLEAIQRLEE